MSKFARLAGYGVGDFGLNIYWNSLSLILVFWYAEVVGLEPKQAGMIYFFGLLWDAVSDPLVASFTAKNQSRYGSYRPFILFGSFALGLSFCLLFWVPPFKGWLLFVMLLCAGIIFRTCYTIVAVPYAALSSRLTFNSVERSELSGVRMIFAFCGMLCVTSFFFPLSREIAGGIDEDATGFFLTAAIGACVATAALVLCFYFTIENEPLGKRATIEPSYFGSYFDCLRRNGALRVLLLILFINAASGASMLIPMAFYLEAFSGQFARKEVVMSLFAFATLAGTPIWTVVARNWGKKSCWYLATGWMALVGLWLLSMGPFIISGVPVQIVLFGFGGSAFAIIIWAIIPDTVEYGQFTYGRRDEGAVFGSSLFVQKASGALTGLIVGFVLSGIGYQPELELQSVETATKLSNFMAVVPAVLLIAASFALSQMPLSRDIHARIVDELSK